MSFTIQRGTNISHWLSQSDARGAERRARFRWEDVARLRDWGFDHLRLPVDEVQMWTPEGQREAEAFTLLGEALDWCQRAGLRAIVDLHILRSHYFMDKNPPLFTDPQEAEKFGRLWGDLSAFCRDRSPDQVAYELMNEPVAQAEEDWNRVARHPYQVIRAAEPERVIVLGSNRWSICRTFDRLWIPENDPRLLLTFHFYHPILVTHHKAHWCPNVREYTGPIQYPGTPIDATEWAKLPEDLRQRLANDNQPCDATVMDTLLAPALAVSQNTGLPLYCGEFGVFHTVPDPLRLRWYRDFISLLDRHHIAWANWDYRGAFGLVDSNNQPTAVLKGLLG